MVCLCCEKGTYGCRSAMVPVHASIGLATFMLAIASSISGLTQKAIWTLGFVHTTNLWNWTFWRFLKIFSNFLKWSVLLYFNCRIFFLNWILAVTNIHNGLKKELLSMHWAVFWLRWACSFHLPYDVRMHQQQLKFMSPSVFNLFKKKK